MSTSGHGRPESTSDFQPSQLVATTRGDNSREEGPTANEKGVDSETAVTIEYLANRVDQVEEVDSEWSIRTTPVKLYGPEEFNRSRMIWMTFTFVLTLLLAGLAALVYLATQDAPSESVLEYLKQIAGPAIWLVSVVVAFYFGRGGRQKQ